jgi:excisionase family DNA binding protein
MRVPKLLSVREAASTVGLARSTLYGLIASNSFPHIRVGKSIRVPYHAINDWIARKLASTQAK